MRAAAILPVLGGLIGSTSAIISGIAVPSEIWPGQTIRVTIITSNYIQTVQDVAISFGISPQNNYHEGWLGQFLSSKFLGPGEYYRFSLLPLPAHVQLRTMALTAIR